MDGGVFIGTGCFVGLMHWNSYVTVQLIYGGAADNVAALLISGSAGE